jgi:hypothetical protein
MSGASFDWFYDLARECIEADSNDDRATELMVSKLMENRVPRWVLERECIGYVGTARYMADKRRDDNWIAEMMAKFDRAATPFMRSTG